MTDEVLLNTIFFNQQTFLQNSLVTKLQCGNFFSPVNVVVMGFDSKHGGLFFFSNIFLFRNLISLLFLRNEHGIEGSHA